MTKIAYLDCPTGIAGDMCLGALVDAGVPFDYLAEALGRLGISKEYQLRAEQVHRNGQRATKVHVDLALPYTSGAGSEAKDAATTAYHLSHHAHSSAGVPREPESHAHVHSYLQQHGHSHSHEPASSGSHTHLTPTRHLPEIEQMILAAGLPSRAEVWSLAVFRQLAEAEGAVHGILPEQVHFHEVGATDAIVDIVGTCLGLDWLGVERIYCSALPVGGGTIRAAHGRLPVPAPAVLKLFELRQIPLYSNGIEQELVTPTGAAIATTLAVQFGPPPSMTLLRVGLGAGTVDLPIPNILRLWIGERKQGTVQEPGDSKQKMKQKIGIAPVSDSVWLSPSESTQPGHIHVPVPYSTSPHPPHSVSHAPLPGTHTPLPPPETVTVLETQIDDLNPQVIGYLYDVLFAAGAVDVFTQAIGMKKSRMGILLTVICPPEAAIACETILFRETTTLGIRHSNQQRQVLQREIQPVETEYGTIRVKIAWMEHGSKFTPVNVQPEYEDCAQIARQYNIPWLKVHRLALQAWYSNGTGDGEQEMGTGKGG
jgi:uncharacterized protein (TIGR00299 family) protein